MNLEKYTLLKKDHGEMAKPRLTSSVHALNRFAARYPADTQA
jgi:hypothetical protein